MPDIKHDNDFREQEVVEQTNVESEKATEKVEAANEETFEKNDVNYVNPSLDDIEDFDQQRERMKTRTKEQALREYIADNAFRNQQNGN